MRLKYRSIILFNLIALSANAPLRAELAPEVAEANSLKAFSTYWGAFEEYERRRQAELREKYQASWQALKDEYNKTQLQLKTQQNADLQEAIKRYRQHLTQHTNTDNRPYTMLNLAQALLALTDIETPSTRQDHSSEKKDALTLLNDLEKNYPNFEHREATIYLSALALESQKQSDQAVATWRRLAAVAQSSLYGAHAHVAVGDAEFSRNNAKTALEHYTAALNLVERLDIPNHDFEMVRAQYRMAWAAYRAADLDIVISSAIALLTPGRDIKSSDYRRRVHNDAVELLGDAIYEQNDAVRMEQTLTTKQLHDYAAAVALHAMQRYDSDRQYHEVIKIGKVVIGNFMSQAAAPACMVILADAYKGLGQAREQIAALERLAMALPKQSLWRAKNKDNLDAISHMENNARFAAKLTAAYHYDRGINTGNTQNFVAAGSFYDILIENDPTGEQSSEWRLRRAHCAYFAGDYREALAAYTELKQQLRVTPAILEVAAYQSVLTQERIWQEEFAKNNQIDAQKELETLEQVVQDFVNRFPEKSRAVDLMLVIAGAYRDSQQLDAASKYWQRALVSKPSLPQRAVAIRGLVMVQMRLGSPGDVVAITKRYLKLENWAAMNISLNNELLGVLAAATIQEGDRLTKTGQASDGGALMVATANEFAGLPNRDRIYRDGAYMLAIGGNWDGARRSASQYKKTGLKGFGGDLQYLEARANEYLIRFAEAAQAYFLLAQNYPRHPSALSGLSRAETLANAEGDFILAAKATQLRASLTPNQNEKMQLYTRSADYYSQAGDAKAVGLVANTRLTASRSIDDQMQSRKLAAKALLQQGKTEGGIVALSSLVNDVRRQKPRMSAGVYSNIYGEANTLLGDDLFAQLEDFNISERSGEITRNTDDKIAVFDRMNRYYEQAIQTQHPTWATKSRYQTAEAASRLADELTLLLKSTSSGFNVKQSQRFLETSKRLRELAKRQHANNLAERSRRPGIHQQNPWVKKSSIKLTGASTSDNQAEYGAPSPTAAQADMPSQWSL